MSAVISLLTQLRGAPGFLKWLPLVLILVPLVYLAFRLGKDLKSWRQARSQRARPHLSLRRTWNAFVRRTPLRQRRALGLFQPYVVLGELGAGKTTLINRHLDWRGQGAQFHPSHVDDPLLQIYRGGNVIVEELAAPLLDDTSQETRAALRRLWRPLRSGRAPEAVIALDVGRLLHASPEQLVRRAQLMRGKLDVLGEVTRRPVSATVVVTKADQLTGFVELATLLGARNTPLSVAPASEREPALAAAFGAFESLLPVLLVSAKPQQYLRVLAFFDQLPSLLAPLETFLQALRKTDALAPAPRLKLVALDANDALGALRPFDTGISAADVRRFRPLRRHAGAAGAAAAVVALAMLGGYHGARARIDSGARRLDALLEAPADPAAQSAWRAVVDEARGSLARRVLPAYFAGDGRFGDAELRRRFVAGVRARLLEPHLGAGEDDAQRLYARSLLAASDENRLGRFVLSHLRQWSDGLALPPSLVRAYVEAADRQPPLYDLSSAATLAQPVAKAQLDTPELSRWIEQLQRDLSRPSIGIDELRALQETAERARRDAERLAERENLAVAAALLADDDGAAARGPSWRRPVADAGPLPASVASLAALVEASRLEPPDVTRLDLPGLTAALKAMVAKAPPAPRPTISLTLDGATVSIDPAEWELLVARSRATLLVRAFVAQEDDGAAALFAAPGDYPALTIGGRGDGCSFGGGARIDGIYTARAFGEHLSPAIGELPSLLAKLPLDDDARQAIADHLSEILEGYADAYAAQYRGLAALRCHARSPLELRVMIGQLLSTGSPLRAALHEITRNTALPLPKENAFAAAFDPLSDEFASLRALAPMTGPATQLDGWVAVLRGIQTALDGRAPPNADKEPEDGLRARLSPLGRMALSIYRGDEDSARVQLERWLATANVSTEWWPAFSAPVEETYALGRRDLQKTVEELWTQLLQTQVQPLADAFPFKRTAEAAVATAALESALAPKQSFWTAFEAQIAPLLVDGRDGWRSREGRVSPLLPADLVATANQLSALSSALWDKEGKPKPLVVRARPLPLAVGDGPAALTTYLQAGGTTIYGFNQHADWTTLKIEWWHADSASVGVAIAGAGGKSFHAINVTDAPWSLWRLLARGSGDGRVFTWQVPGPDGRALAVQFEIKDDPWARFALR